MFSFNIEEFFLVLESYNLAIWPLQVFAYILITLALFFLFKPARYSMKIVLAILSFFWLFNGIVFSFIYWSPSHLFGYIFGVFCVIQGFLFLYSIKKSDLVLGSPDKTYALTGLLLIFYAIIGYQILGYFLGHVYPKFFPPGLVPCPTTVFTFGVFLIISKRIPMKYYLVPLILSLGGFLAAYNGIYEDIGLIISGVLGTILIIKRAGQDELKETTAI
jgi:hypothetical protein